MAISKIKKLEILGLEEDKDRLLALLQHLGLVELISTKPQISVSQTNLLEIEEALSYLAVFKEKAGLLEGMVKLKPLVYPQEFKEVIASFDYEALLKELSELRSRQKKFFEQRERLMQEAHLLVPWQNLSIPLDQMHATQNCGILLGVLRWANYSRLLADVKGLNLFYQVINQDRANTYLVIIYLQEELEQVEQILKKHHFNFITLSQHKTTVKNRLLEIDRQTSVLNEGIQQTKAKITELSKEQFKLMVVYDYLANIKNRQDMDGRLTRQQFTFMLSGWVRDKDIKLLEKAVGESFQDIAIFISEPKTDEDIPTALENPPLVRPFEVITNLYGQPVYNGLDPTAYLAPFFAFSFGFCMLDAGYGLMLLAITLFFLKKRQISMHGKKFLKLFLFAALATTLAGLITGTFFGDLVVRLPEKFGLLKDIQKCLIIFDPMKEPLVFLGFVLSLGFVQIWTGVFIKFLRDMRQDKFTALILDLPTLLVQASLLTLVLVFTKILPAFMARYAGVVLIMSAIMVIYYHWKSNRQVSLKIFWSLFGIYSIITGNFLADTLSFSRIFALGLTGGLLGMAVNTMLFPKEPLTNIFAFIAAIAAIAALFLGHIFNLAICLLGAYVHTSRLQYLEFFTKFFQSGGRPFRPFKQETKYIFLAEPKIRSAA